MVDIELLAATVWFWTFLLGFLFSIITYIILLFTPFLLVLIPYAIWIWYDRKTAESGGRPLESVRKTQFFQLVKNYFNYKLTTDGNVKLDPRKNYIMACFPHGVCPLGSYGAFIDGYQTIFPQHKAFSTVLGMQFWFPFMRELFLALGSVAVTASSIKYLLNKETGGNVVSIAIGGAEESKYSKRNLHKVVLNKRKGFVKMALEQGANIIPAYTFGENEIYEICSVFGLFNVPKGRCGIFPSCAGLLPNRANVVTVVGQPIEVQKNAQPTREDVDRLHEEFTRRLTQLFNNNKHKYVENPENTFLEIV